MDWLKYRAGILSPYFIVIYRKNNYLIQCLADEFEAFKEAYFGWAGKLCCLFSKYYARNVEQEPWFDPTILF